MRFISRFFGVQFSGRKFAQKYRGLLFFAVLASLAQSQPSDIADQLAQLAPTAGFAYKEIPATVAGYRVFDIKFKQPEDHKNLAGPWFEQRIVLWHHDSASPMVLQTSGYAIFGIALAALASEFSANQIQVEHRFFADSVPADQNWSFDNIEQSANDFHRITVAFKQIYGRKWVNTGRSKGGMTSVYHRRFFPADLDATVAHVAPLSFSVEDKRYADFVSDKIGGDANAVCRENLVSAQRVLLKHKADIAGSLPEGGFAFLGSRDIAVEHSVIELPWTYWQYSGPATIACDKIPTEASAPSDAVAFLNKINSPTDYSDAALQKFIPYYYQAATQLGNPATRLSDIVDLLNHAETFTIFNYVPKGVDAHYDNAAAMNDVASWVSQSSERMLFVYGEYDPWGAGPFEPRAEGDSYRFYVAKTNHSAQFTDLTGADRALAYGKLHTWLNLADEPASPSVRKSMTQPTLEQIEFEALRGHR